MPLYEIPWAGIGALLLGLGSTLSGWASLTLARKQGKKFEKSGHRVAPQVDVKEEEVNQDE